VKRIGRILPLTFLPLFCIQFAGAQSRFDLNIGFGAIQDSATGQGIEGDQTGTYSVTPGSPCTVGVPTDPTCTAAQKLSGFYIGFGGDLMLKKHLGVGANVSFTTKETYATFPQVTSLGQELEPPYKDQIRLTLYSFDAIYEPLSEKKYAVDILGGIGGVSEKPYQQVTAGASTFNGNNASTQSANTSNHFQLHAGVGVTIFLNDHFFVRPQFDMHYVPNLTDFGRKILTSEMVWVGYSFGDR